MTVQPTRDQLRALADRATEGPWKVDYCEEDNYAIKSPGAEWGDGYAYVADAVDAAFIAAARTAVPALLDMLDQAEADRDWLFRSSRLSKEGRIKANTRADQAEARIKAVRDVFDEPDAMIGTRLHVSAYRILRALDG